MNHIDVITIFPEMFSALHFGIVGRAIKQQLIQLNFFNPRDYAPPPHYQVDDRPYGGGPGMIMKAGPLQKAIQAAKDANSAPAKVLYLSPQGRPLTQAAINQLINNNHLIMISGRYEGIDQRLIEQKEIDEIWSIGDYIVSGGELPIMLLIDALTRVLPGALGDPESAVQESFNDGLLDTPHYTRPQEFNGLGVPDVLLSGDHQAIARWRLQQSLGNTWQNRPDMLKSRILNKEEQQLLDRYIDEHKI